MKPKFEMNHDAHRFQGGQREDVWEAAEVILPTPNMDTLQAGKFREAIWERSNKMSMTQGATIQTWASIDTWIEG